MIFGNIYTNIMCTFSMLAVATKLFVTNDRSYAYLFWLSCCVFENTGKSKRQNWFSIYSSASSLLSTFSEMNYNWNIFIFFFLQLLVVIITVSNTLLWVDFLQNATFTRVVRKKISTSLSSFSSVCIYLYMYVLRESKQ